MHRAAFPGGIDMGMEVIYSKASMGNRPMTSAIGWNLVEMMFCKIWAAIRPLFSPQVIIECQKSECAQSARRKPLRITSRQLVTEEIV